ncbi:hypothetical protein COO60DRAFT_1708159 [Scenedesmus sp. NREL 46B-D3]|nr:hypothetical protein COO60DRAFT_1708159 [Scenedesmus sp. NREL 46B-D3]
MAATTASTQTAPVMHGRTASARSSVCLTPRGCSMSASNGNIAAGDGCCRHCHRVCSSSSLGRRLDFRHAVSIKGLLGPATQRVQAVRRSKDPDSCLKCAKDPRGQFSKKPVNYLISKGSKAQNACAVCAGLAGAKQKKRCFECILDNKRCSTCVHGARMWGYGKPDIAACLACSAKKGGRYVGACNACAQSSSPKRCFACLDTQPLKICNTTQRAGSDGCNIGPNDQTPCDLCSNAAQSDDVFRQCLACHTEPNVQQECLDCGNIPTTAATQARCFACVKAARFPSYASTGCAACFSSWLMPGKTQACLQCVESSTTPAAAKASCSSCVDATTGRSQPLQDKCFGCLKGTQVEDYSATCLDQGMRR